MTDAQSPRPTQEEAARARTMDQALTWLIELEIAGQLGVSTSTVQKELKLVVTLCLAVAARLDH